MLKRLLQDEKIISVFGTLLIHLLLLLLFLTISINFDPVIEEFTEVSLAGGFKAPTIRQESQITEQPEELMESQADLAQSLPENIELPERREAELDEDEILEKIKPIPEKIFASKKIAKKITQRQPQMPRSTRKNSPFVRREKQDERGLFRKDLDEKLLTGSQKVDINVDRQFEIDWQGEIKREIYQKRLPEFPPDVQQEATIKIQFTVLANGLVGSAILLQKGDTRLENLTLESFKTWRFNPLPDYVEPVAQSGIISFHFKLK